MGTAFGIRDSGSLGLETLVSAPAAERLLDEAPPVSRTAESRPHEPVLAKDFFPGDSRGRARRRWMLGADLIALGGAALAFYLLYMGELVAGTSTATALVLAAFIVSWVGACAILGYYHLPERRLDYSLGDDFVPVLLATTVATWAGLIVTSVVADGVIVLGPWVLLWVSSMVLVHISRTLMRRASLSRDWYRQKVMVVGTSGDLRRIRRRLERHPEFGLDITSAAYLDPPDGDGGRSANGTASIHLPIQSLFAADAQRVSEIVEFARSQQVNRVLVATPPRGLDEREVLIRALSDVGFAVDIASTEVGGVSQRASLHHVEGLPMVTVPALDRGKAVLIAKRGFDVTCSIAALTILSPLLLAVALAIKLTSPGPVLFRQPRAGKRRTEFEIFKFRTMVDGADALRDEMRDHDSQLNGDGDLFKIVGDPRVTKVGKWLRRFSIDEVPQLINVLRGDMSIVGPRPLPMDESERIGDDYEARFLMRPGLTGPWQVNGRSYIGFDDMVRLDESYCRHWSLAGDVSLIVRTVSVVTSGRGAY